jgi:CRP-like cAMP-binding protein
MAKAHPENLLAKKLSAFLPLSEDEHRRLSALQSRSVKVKRGKQLIQEGQTGHRMFVVQSGWACSYKILPNGGRQIISFPVPGDCVGLGHVFLRTADRSFSTLTDAVVSLVDDARILETIDDFPRLRAAILWAASCDEAMVAEHLVRLGRRSATERTAHYFLELAERLQLVGLGTVTEFNCPLRQHVLADALGLSPVHVNRVLRELRERDLLTFRGGKVRIHDLSSLKKLAGYRDGYLNARHQTGTADRRL